MRGIFQFFSSQRAVVAVALCLMAAPFGVGCASIDTSAPEVSLVNLQFSDVQLFETTMKVAVRYENFDDKPLNITGASHRISLNGSYIGRGASAKQIEIAPYESATDELVVHLSNISLFQRIQEIVNGGTVDYAVDSKLGIAGSFFGRSIRAQSHGTLDLGPAFKNSESTPERKNDAVRKLNSLPTALETPSESGTARQQSPKTDTSR